VFDTLIESKPRKKKNAGQMAISLGLHAALIFGAVKATNQAAETLSNVLKDTTMVFLAPPKATPPPPPPQDVIVSATPPPQGFQTVVPPAEIPTEIPPVNLNERFDPKDFTGKGVEGGIATGVVGGTGPVPTVNGEVFLAADIDDPPAAVSIPTPRYPEVLRQAGIAGTVQMQFVVDTTGHVEPNSWKAMKSSHKAFEEPAREAILKGVFKPGKSRGNPVRVLVQQVMRFSISQ
jgi:protein TonB